MTGRNGAVLLGLGTLLLVILAAGRLGLPQAEYGDLSDPSAAWYTGAALLGGLVYAAAVVLIRSRPVPRWALLAGIAIALLARGVLLATPPVMSTDLYRYVWDGRVQAAGINPYRYLPSDPAVAFLRDGRTGPTAIFININRPETAKTIYPPAAQLLFAAIGQAASSIWTIKAAMTLCDLLTAAAIAALLRMAGRPAAWVLVWLWNPLVILEFAGAGHIDALGIAFTSLALLLAARARPGAAGAALGIAIISKFLPAVVAPALWRPRSWRAPVAAGAVILAGYACYLSVGWGVFGYLSGYTQEEGLGQGSGYVLLRVLAAAGSLPGWAGPVYMGAALALLGALALWIVLRGGPPRADVMARDALLLSVALLVALSPHYPWYIAAVVMPAAIVPGWGPLWSALAGPLLYWDVGLGHALWPAIVYLPALVWLLAALRKGVGHA